MDQPASGDGSSVRFDRAADYYDRTRALSPQAHRATVELLATELSGLDPCLEIGVGTGLVAIPLHEAGISVVGIDLSAPMLHKLVEKAGGRAPFPLALADATRMPFADDVFGGAVVRWVFHLVPEWRRAVEELARTAAPGGKVLVNLGFGAFDHKWELVDRFLELAGGEPFAVGLDPRRPEVLDEEFARHGAQLRELRPWPDSDETTVGEFLEEIEAGMHSWSWRVPGDVRRRITPELRTWAVERFGSLDGPIDPDVRIGWRAYDLL